MPDASDVLAATEALLRRGFFSPDDLETTRAAIAQALPTATPDIAAKLEACGAVLNRMAATPDAGATMAFGHIDIAAFVGGAAVVRTEPHTNPNT